MAGSYVQLRLDEVRQRQAEQQRQLPSQEKKPGSDYFVPQESSNDPFGTTDSAKSP